MKRILATLFLGITCTLVGFDYTPPPKQPTNEAINVENRILLKVNGRAITTMDVVRKMDVLFYRQYPEMASSDAARFQYYQMSWELILQTVIDEELMLADAEEKQIPITDGEVRQEMERHFGPQVVLTLDKLQLTYQEAFDLIKRELIVQKITSAFVGSRAMAEVSPAAIKEAYQKLLEEPLPDNKFAYQCITVRGNDEHLCKEVAEKIVALQKKENLPLEELVEKVNKESVPRVALSEKYEREQEDIALTHLKELKKLQEGEVSAPLLQTSRSNRPYYRLFVLHEYKEGEHPPLSEVEGQLKQQLMQAAYVVHGEKYRDKLRAHYDISEKYLASFTPKEFTPFALR